MNERSVFLAAVEIDDVEKRAAYLRDACGKDAELRRCVEELLQANAVAGSFMDAPAATVGSANAGTNPDSPMSLDFLTASDQPGSIGRLGSYEITRVIGCGGMGIVLEGRDTRLNRVVAVKVLAPQLAVAAAARQRFSREAKAAAAVRDEHVVTIYAVEEAENLPYLVMELIAGMSLQERIDRDGPLELKEILRIGVQTARGLAAAHGQGLIHRDVKPANILLENGVERVKLTDFGLARVADEASLTQSGVIAGTPAYMSPEQAKGEVIDHRSDLFSLGSVLYAMCTGQSPFRGSTTLGVIKRVCEEQPRPIRDLNLDIPDWLCAIISQLHAKNPAERYQSAAKVADLLSQHLAQLQQPADSKPVSQSAIGNRQSAIARRWAIVVAAAVVLLLFGISLTEATGLTKVAATVIRILTPEGTLVIEASDPDVKVTIQGDGGLAITTAGGQQVRLPAGRSYKLRAAKDGQLVPLDRDLVTITQGQEQVVKVRLEAPAVTAAPAAQTQRGAFVVLGGKGVSERKFDTLAEAVRGASDGDAIEIRDNGPFISEPIDIQGHSLNIRAAEGFQPVIVRKTAGEGARSPLLTTNGRLVLEGLEFAGDVHFNAVHAYRPLYVANCRFTDGYVSLQHAPICQVQNCLFSGTAYLNLDQPGRALVANNIMVRRGPNCLVSFDDSPRPNELHLRRNILLGMDSVQLAYLSTDGARARAPLRVEASENILGHTTGVLLFFKKGSPSAAEAEDALPRVVAWHEERNLYPEGVAFLRLGGATKLLQPTRDYRSLAEWNQLWGLADTGSVQGRISYAREEVGLAHTADRPDPSDFRLQPGSAGKGAGKDGMDLGPDVDLVGPGQAYERWKQTAEYQQWLKDTGQLKQ
jgi:serine/threonine protein kinase